MGGGVKMVASIFLEEKKKKKVHIRCLEIHRIQGIHPPPSQTWRICTEYEK